MIYEIEAPDGRILEVEGPEGASDEQVLQAAAQLYNDLVKQAQALSPQQLSGEIPVADPVLSQFLAGPAPQEPERGIGETLVGAGETALSLATGIPAAVTMPAGALSGLAGAVMSGEYGTPQGAQRVAQAAQEAAGLTMYQPRTEAGREMLEAVGEAASVIPPVMPLAPELAAATRLARPAVAPAVRAAGETVGEATGAMRERAGQLMAREVSPEELRLRSAGAAEVEGARRRVETARGLPVPIELTKGAATRNADQITFERAQMKQALGGPLRDRIEENNLQILQNFDAFVDMSGEDAARILGAGPAEVGRTVIDSLKEGLQRQKNKVNVAYQKARAAGETKEPVDVDTLVSYMNDAQAERATAPIVETLRKIMIRDKLAEVGPDGNLRPVPKVGYDAVMNRPGVSTVNIDDLERFRQAVNKNAGLEPTNVRQATIIKGIIDDLTEGKGGDLYEKARKLRREQAEVFENRAVVARLIENVSNMDDPRVAAERVFEKSIKNASLDEINFLKDTLNKKTGKRGKQAWKNLEAATVNYIRDKALTTATDSRDQRIVSPAGLTRAVEELDANGRLEAIFGKSRAQQMRDLAEVSRYVATAPPGAIINTSDSANLILAALAETGAGFAMTGIPAPVLSIIKASKDWRDKAKLKKRINDALEGSSFAETPTE
jgi:hypothetical protein